MTSLAHAPAVPGLPGLFDAAVVIGRWQPPHLGHDALFQRALAIAPRVIIMLGSALRSRDTRHPFTAQEREDMILACLSMSCRPTDFWPGGTDLMTNSSAPPAMR